jgi:hypothetical protein
MRCVRVDTPWKRFTAVTVTTWLIGVLVLGSLSFIEHLRADESRAEANLWSARHQALVKARCGHLVRNEKCIVSETAYEMFEMEATLEIEHRDCSDACLLSALALLVGVPLLLALAIWVCRGTLRP